MTDNHVTPTDTVEMDQYTCEVGLLYIQYLKCEMVQGYTLAAIAHALSQLLPTSEQAYHSILHQLPSRLPIYLLYIGHTTNITHYNLHVINMFLKIQRQIVASQASLKICKHQSSHQSEPLSLFNNVLSASHEQVTSCCLIILRYCRNQYIDTLTIFGITRTAISREKFNTHK